MEVTYRRLLGTLAFGNSWQRILCFVLDQSKAQGGCVDSGAVMTEETLLTGGGCFPNSWSTMEKNDQALA